MLIGWLVSLLCSAVAFWIVSRLVPGWRINSFGTAVVVALVYGVLAHLLWALKIPMIIASLPFMIIIPAKLVGLVVWFAFNLGIVYLTDLLVEDFHIDGLATAVVGCIVLTVVRAFLPF